MRHPAGEFEITKREIAIFMIFKKLRLTYFYIMNLTLSSRYYLIRESKLTKNEIDSYEIKFDKASISNQWEEGKLYEIGKS